MRTPWIAVTADYDWKGEKYNIAAAYIRAVERAGGQAAVLLPGENREVRLPDWADGLLLTGGSDLDPMYFGEAVRRGNRDINPRRDAWELSLARRCTEEERPIFGICRGIQVMAVAAGGTIVQDIYEGEAATRLQHEQRAPGDYPTHEVFLAQDSRLAAWTGKRRLRVNSFHHQSVAAAGDFQITGRSPDGLPEVIERADRPFWLGVQWHPERMTEDADSLKLFEIFIEACRGEAAAGSEF